MQDDDKMRRWMRDVANGKELTEEDYKALDMLVKCFPGCSMRGGQVDLGDGGPDIPVARFPSVLDRMTWTLSDLERLTGDT